MARKEALQKITQTLIRRRRAISNALKDDLSLLQSQSGGDEVDWAIDAMQDELNSQLAEVESRELGQIDAALSRVAEGRFGNCDGCDKAIPLDRLRAIPHASLCIVCQRQAELNPDNGGEEASWSRLPATDDGDRPVRFEDIEVDSY